VLFSPDGCHTSLVSGCDFHLDAGIYELVLRDPARKRSRFLSRPITTWIRVRKKRETFDLRSQSPSTRAQMAASRSSQKSIQSQVNALSDEVDKFAERFATTEEALVLLLDQFALVDNSGEKPVRVERPFQWLANRLVEIEIDAASKKEEDDK